MKRIIIVDDDPVVLKIYQNRFQADGFDVIAVRDGQSALNHIRKQPPADAVLLDLMMPGMDGIAVLNAIRAEPGKKNLPVVVLSNSYHTQMVQAAWKAGATKCLSKTDSTPRHVGEILRELLSKKTDELEAGRANDPASQSIDLRRSFLYQAPPILNSIRANVQLLYRAELKTQPTSEFFELARLLDLVGGMAGVAGLPRFAQLAAALEALLRELSTNAALGQASTIRTVAQAVDQLSAIAAEPLSRQMQPMPQCCVLGIDDESVSRRLIRSALAKGQLKAITVSTPEAALALLEENTFDLILTDINMPGMDGITFCKKAREYPTAKNVPVIFATVSTDFQTRVESTLAGGTELISKPYLLLELAVKSLTLILSRPPVT